MSQMDEALHLINKWFPESPNQLHEVSLPKEIVTLIRCMTNPSTPLLEKWARRIAAPLFSGLPPGGRVLLSTLLKYLQKSPPAKFQMVGDLAWIRLISYLGLNDEEHAHERFRICLTHDVDWPQCYEFTPRILEIEEKYSVKSTFNILMDWGYKVDLSLLREITDRGFEVGLHGMGHDISFAYRPLHQIRDTLQKMKELCPVPVRGFRSPALSVSANLLQALEETGFAYDSSFSVFPPAAGATETIYPYTPPGRTIIEVPLALQDSYLFRDLRLSDSEALELTLRMIEDFRRRGGTFVFNGHPGILKDHLDFYEKILDHLDGKGNSIQQMLLKINAT